jgi:hypothetical protein
MQGNKNEAMQIYLSRFLGDFLLLPTQNILTTKIENPFLENKIFSLNDR